MQVNIEGALLLLQLRRKHEEKEKRKERRNLSLKKKRETREKKGIGGKSGIQSMQIDIEGALLLLE